MIEIGSQRSCVELNIGFRDPEIPLDDKIGNLV
jgi:hypothetical protein